MNIKTKSIVGATSVLIFTGMCFGVQAHVATKNVQLGKSASEYVLVNNSKNTIECAQMIGGYCSNNPVKAGQHTRILPDPGSQLVRGRIMIMNPKVAGRYFGNILLVAKKQKQAWQLSLTALYNKDNLKNLNVKMAK
jgi:hypothetical protein